MSLRHTTVSLLLASSVFVSIATAQDATTTQDALVKNYGIDADAAKLFAKVEPEFLRYHRQVTFFGNTLASTQPAKALVDEEEKLYRDRLAATKLAKPDRTDGLLCFNLLVHRPDVGREYLNAIVNANTPGRDRFVDATITNGMRASGEWGEQFAVKGLASTDVAWRRECANYLAREGNEEGTATSVRKALTTEKDSAVRSSLYYALGLLIARDALADAKAAFETEKDVEVRSAMVFAVAEIMGRDSLKWLESRKVTDERVKTQIQQSIDYMRTGTTEDNKHGFEISNDAEFVMRFGDLKTPAIAWLQKQGFLDEAVVDSNKKLDKATKAQLFDALELSLGFGLEAAKGSLFASLEKSDLPRLRKLRKLGAYSPNSIAQQRRSTLMIMIRSLRE